MRYFVESVSVYSTTGKTRKGAILQKAALQFEHIILGDHMALKALIKVFKKLAAACDSTYRGAQLRVDYTDYQLSVRPEKPSFDEKVVFIMHLAPVGLTHFSSNIHQAVYTTVKESGDRQLLEAYAKGGEA